MTPLSSKRGLREPLQSVMRNKTPCKGDYSKGSLPVSLRGTLRGYYEGLVTGPWGLL